MNAVHCSFWRAPAPRDTRPIFEGKERRNERHYFLRLPFFFFSFFSSCSLFCELICPARHFPISFCDYCSHLPFSQSFIHCFDVTLLAGALRRRRSLCVDSHSAVFSALEDGWMDRFSGCGSTFVYAFQCLRLCHCHLPIAPLSFVSFSHYFLSLCLCLLLLLIAFQVVIY